MHPLFPKANEVAKDVVDAANEVLRTVDMGLLESVYNRCLTYELRLRGHAVASEKYVEYDYKGLRCSDTLRADLIVDDCVVVELKSVECALRAEYKMQLLSYMRLLNCPLGLLINFGATSTTRFNRLILRGADEWAA